MKTDAIDFGSLNPHAPQELSRFGFLVGTWRCEAQEPAAKHAFTRATYCNISDTHFTRRGERSSDGSTWEEFLVIEAEHTDN